MIDEILGTVVAGKLRSFSVGSVYLYVTLYHAQLADRRPPAAEPRISHLGHCVWHSTALGSQWKTGKFFTIDLPLKRVKVSVSLGTTFGPCACDWSWAPRDNLFEGSSTYDMESETMVSLS